MADRRFDYANESTLFNVAEVGLVGLVEIGILGFAWMRASRPTTHSTNTHPF